MVVENLQEGAQRFYNKGSLYFNNITLPIRLYLLLPMALLLSFLLTFTSNNYSYHYHLSAFILPLFTHTFEKKYLFILCTTILTFITKKEDPNLKENIYHDKLIYSLSEMEGAIVLERSNKEIEYGKLDEEESKEVYEKNTENSEVMVEDEEGVSEEEGLVGVEQEEHGETNMDTEELNKKIEEFIRKMREELKVQAEQNMISV